MCVHVMVSIGLYYSVWTVYQSHISSEHLIHVSLQGEYILVVLANGTRPDKPLTIIHWEHVQWSVDISVIISVIVLFL